MEKVDIVDESLKFVRTTTRDEAHKRGLLHKTVIAELRDSAGNWLLVKQASHKQDAGRYVSPMGGHVCSGETDEEALKREVLEELGIIDFEYVLKGKVIFNRKVSNHIENHYFIVYEIYSDTLPTLNDESVEYDKIANEELKTQLKKNPLKFGDALIFLLEKIYPELTS